MQDQTNFNSSNFFNPSLILHPNYPGFLNQLSRSRETTSNYQSRPPVTNTYIYNPTMNLPNVGGPPSSIPLVNQNFSMSFGSANSSMANEKKPKQRTSYSRWDPKNDKLILPEFINAIGLPDFKMKLFLHTFRKDHSIEKDIDYVRRKLKEKVEKFLKEPTEGIEEIKIKLSVACITKAIIPDTLLPQFQRVAQLSFNYNQQRILKYDLYPQYSGNFNSLQKQNSDYSISYHDLPEINYETSRNPSTSFIERPQPAAMDPVSIVGHVDHRSGSSVSQLDQLVSPSQTDNSNQVSMNVKVEPEVVAGSDNHESLDTELEQAPPATDGTESFEQKMPRNSKRKEMPNKDRKIKQEPGCQVQNTSSFNPEIPNTNLYTLLFSFYLTLRDLNHTDKGFKEFMEETGKHLFDNQVRLSAKVVKENELNFFFNGILNSPFLNQHKMNSIDEDPDLMVTMVTSEVPSINFLKGLKTMTCMLGIVSRNLEPIRQKIDSMIGNLSGNEILFAGQIKEHFKFHFDRA